MSGIAPGMLKRIIKRLIDAAFRRVFGLPNPPPDPFEGFYEVDLDEEAARALVKAQHDAFEEVMLPAEELEEKSLQGSFADQVARARALHRR